MIERELEIINRLGLHARAAAKFVQLAGRYSSKITVIKDGEEVDAKSILGLLLLAAAQGSKVMIRCEGEDEDVALTALSTLVGDRFEEEN
jgi:phosphocarrier protein